MRIVANYPILNQGCLTVRHFHIIPHALLTGVWTDADDHQNPPPIPHYFQPSRNPYTHTALFLATARSSTKRTILYTALWNHILGNWKWLHFPRDCISSCPNKQTHILRLYFFIILAYIIHMYIHIDTYIHIFLLTRRYVDDKKNRVHKYTLYMP